MAARVRNAGAGVAGRIEPMPAAFPARTKQTSAVVNGTRTDVTTMSFADKILVLISQQGILAHWVHVPLESTDPTLADRHRQISDDGSDLLPLPHLTATTILGGGAQERDTMGQLFATQIASAIASKSPEERRLLVVGMGFKKGEFDTDGFVQIVGMVVGCL